MESKFQTGRSSNCIRENKTIVRIHSYIYKKVPTNKGPQYRAIKDFNFELGNNSSMALTIYFFFSTQKKTKKETLTLYSCIYRKPVHNKKK
jgi:hypothetical protein